MIYSRIRKEKLLYIFRSNRFRKERGNYELSYYRRASEKIKEARFSPSIKGQGSKGGSETGVASEL